MKRTIRIADFEYPCGPIGIEDLIGMPHGQWEHLRHEINRRRKEEPERPLARCRLCKGSVFIRARHGGDSNVPEYVHHSDAPVDCPWRTDTNLVPDDARAAQYRGHQESALHRWLCEQIAAALRRDPRVREVAVDRYRRPTIEKRGRYPDVYVEFSDAGAFAIEVQLSKPFATEIAARQLHYEREDVRLVWVFHELPDQLPQGFWDVITQQRGNAFVFNEELARLSHERGTLVLKALLETADGAFGEARDTELSGLKTNERRVAMLEDRRSARLIAEAQERRRPYLRAFRDETYAEDAGMFGSPLLKRAWGDLVRCIPDLNALPTTSDVLVDAERRRTVSELVAILFSIVHTSQTGEPRLYVTRYKGEGALRAMLNSKLSNATFHRYATLIRTVLERTRARAELANSKLREKFELAQEATNQAGSANPVWQAMQWLLPEVLDGATYAELQEVNALPRWADAGSRRVGVTVS